MTFNEDSLNPGQTGAKRQSWEDFNPRAVLLRVMKERPRASEKEIHDVVKTEIFEEVGYLHAIFNYWFTHNYQATEVRERDHSVAILKKTMSKARRATIREHIERKHVEFTHGILMDMELSCGKLLREAKGSDLDKETGFLAEVRKNVKPSQLVGKVLTEEELHNLWKRHYIKGKKGD
jgi:hypothetical protein